MAVGVASPPTYCVSTKLAGGGGYAVMVQEYEAGGEVRPLRTASTRS
jgi:hypothetical protein